MNEKFYLLSPQKQRQIIRAGYRVFSKNTYAKSPVGQVALEAGISKSLLFYYFRNKKEFYLFLWDEAIKTQETVANEIWKQTTYFKMLETGMKQKLYVMKTFPEMSDFILKAFFEDDPEVSGEIRKRYQLLMVEYSPFLEKLIDPEEFVEGVDVHMMYQEMCWACEGYLRTALQKVPWDFEMIEAQFQQLIDFWKQVYLRDNRGEQKNGANFKY